MVAAARLAASRGSVVVRSEAGGADGDLLNVACPLQVDGTPIGVVSLQVAQSVEQQRAVTQLLSWGVSWLQALVGCEAVAFTRRMLALLEVTNASVEEPRLDGAAEATATRLAALADCTRVSVGLRGRRGVRVVAISGAGRAVPR